MNLKLKRLLLNCICLTIASGFISLPTPQSYIYAETENNVKLYINEVCTQNNKCLLDSYGVASDWIELYNASSIDISLDGYGLSDDVNSLLKWTFPSNTIIKSGEHLVVFASKQSSTDKEYHTGFALSKNGETVYLSNPNGDIIQKITIPPLSQDITYGRSPDGSEILTTMTPTPNITNKVSISAPVFSKESGFYDTSFNLNISAPNGYSIYYTTDGSTPTIDSTLYTKPISIYDTSNEPNVFSAIEDVALPSLYSKVTDLVDKSYIIRAIAVDNLGNVSDVVTNSYFVGYQTKADYYKNIKTISIVTDGENLFDYDKGIYVVGSIYDKWKNSDYYNPELDDWDIPANYTQKGKEWERPATIQVFNNGNLELSQDVGIRIHGGATRSYTQKSFNIYARGEYGQSKMEYDFFSSNVTNQYNDDTITSFDSIILRNGGNDAQYSRFRDRLNQTLVADRNIATQGMEQCIVFINGEYWGTYDITEKLSDYYIQSHYNIPKNDVCLIKNYELEEGNAQYFQEYQELYDWVSTTDLSIDENYNELCSKVDMQSFLDYISAEIYYSNWDWGWNNIAFWKSQSIDKNNPYADGKWRFILFDTEFSVNLYNSEDCLSSTNSFEKILNEDSFISVMFKSLLANDTFKEQFTNTFMDITNVNFESNKVNNLINQYSTDYHAPTIDTFNRFWSSWPGGMYAESQFTQQVNSIRSFYNNRKKYITEYLKSTLELTGDKVNVTIKNKDSLGTVTLNTTTLNINEDSWTGKYFTDYPITLTVAPKNESIFLYWKTSNNEILTDTTINLSFDDDITIEAVYDMTTLKGDINMDKKISNIDVLMLKKYLLDVITLNDTTKSIADMNNDNKINIMDLILLKNQLLDNI